MTAEEGRGEKSESERGEIRKLKLKLKKAACLPLKRVKKSQRLKILDAKKLFDAGSLSLHKVLRYGCEVIWIYAIVA